MENYAYSAGVDMKKHFFPVEKTLIIYEGQCNWCGKKKASMTQDEIIEMAKQQLELQMPSELEVKHD